MTSKLTFMDTTFLRLESRQRPFHVAGLMVLRLPEGDPAAYLRRLARHCGRLNELWPVFNRRLSDPDRVSKAIWVEAGDYDPDYHVRHYALPAPGRMQNLLKIVSREHEQLLDRDRPLWELHLIEGLEGGRFAIYCKVHHALVDGVGALRMVNALFSEDPDTRIDFRRARPVAEEHHARIDRIRQLGSTARELRKQYEALPQVGSMLGAMGMDALMGRKDVPPLPFTAPRTLFNTDVDARRRIIVAELPLAGMRKLAKAAGGTLNDVLLAVCGGALRTYLQDLDALPRKSMEAGVPVSLKQPGQEAGNQVSFMFCQMYTNEPDPLRRLQRVIKVSSKAKAEMRKVSPTAAQDVSNLLFIPTLLLTLTGTASLVNPAINAIVSNVPGSRRPLYLEGATLEALYPFSIVTDGVGLNITVVSYDKKLCIAATSCPTEQPGIEKLGKLLKASYRELVAASRKG